MSTEEGTITKVVGDKAWVMVRRSSACDGCKSGGICNSLGGSGNMEAEAINTAGGKVGDRALMKLSSKSIWKISFMFYMIPVIFLAAGAAESLDFGDRHAVNADLGEALLDFVELERLDDCLDFFHAHLLRWRLDTGRSLLTGGCNWLR